jgi:hypothetical protein
MSVLARRVLLAAIATTAAINIAVTVEIRGSEPPPTLPGCSIRA